MRPGDPLLVLDPKRVRALRELVSPESPGVDREVVRLFVETAWPTAGSIRTAWRAGNREAVRRFCHRLRGSAANVGANRLVFVCRTMEATAPTGFFPPSMADALEREVETACSALRREFLDAAEAGTMRG